MQIGCTYDQQCCVRHLVLILAVTAHPPLMFACYARRPAAVVQRAVQLEERLHLLPGLVEKLQQGVKVADVGCG